MVKCGQVNVVTSAVIKFLLEKRRVFTVNNQRPAQSFNKESLPQVESVAFYANQQG